MNIAALARQHGMPPIVLRARIKRGLTVEAAVAKPYKPQGISAADSGIKKCVTCGQIKPNTDFVRLKRRGGRNFAPACRSCDSARSRENRRALRLLLLSHYCNGAIKCSHCPESRIDVLDLDHVHGGGIKERKKFKTPFAYYLWLRNSDFPDGYRVLCRNCNWLAWIARKDKGLKYGK